MTIILSVVVVLVVMYFIISKPKASSMSNDIKPDLVLDVRTLGEWGEGNGKSAINIPLDELPNRLKELEQYKDKNVVVVCRSGARAGQGVSILTKAGFQNLENGGPWQNYSE